jgi:hypothetical protein
VGERDFDIRDESEKKEKKNQQRRVALFHNTSREYNGRSSVLWPFQLLGEREREKEREKEQIARACILAPGAGLGA